MDIQSLKRRLQDSVSRALHESIETEIAVKRIQTILSEIVNDRELVLPASFYEINPAHYARRLLYRDNHNGTVAVIMTWAPGQSTPIHDHGGIWCVEGVVVGRMEVEQYDLIERSGNLCKFAPAARVFAEVGSTGSLIPPFEHHVLANRSDQPSLTLHVYGAEMDRCHIYSPETGGWYRPMTQTLELTE